MKFEIPQKDHEAYHLWHMQCIGLEQFCSAPKFSKTNPLRLYGAGRHTKKIWWAGWQSTTWWIWLQRLRLFYIMDAASILGAAPAVYCRVYRAWGANGAIQCSGTALGWIVQYYQSARYTIEDRSGARYFHTMAGRQGGAKALVAGRRFSCSWISARSKGRASSGASSHGRKSGSENWVLNYWTIYSVDGRDYHTSECISGVAWGLTYECSWTSHRCGAAWRGLHCP